MWRWTLLLCTDSTVFTTILYHSFIHSLLHTLPYSVLPRPSIHFSSICALLSNHFGSMSMYCILHSNTNIVIVFVDDSHINGYHTIGLSECYSKHSRRPGPIDVGCVCVCICVCICVCVEISRLYPDASGGQNRTGKRERRQCQMCAVPCCHVAKPTYAVSLLCTRVCTPFCFSSLDMPMQVHQSADADHSFFLYFLHPMAYTVFNQYDVTSSLSLSLSFFLTCSILLISCAKSRQFPHG